MTGTSVLQIAYPVHAPAGDLKFVRLASLNLEKFLLDLLVRGVEVLLMAADGTVLAWSPADTRARHQGTSIKDRPLFAFATGHSAGGAAEVAGIEGNRQVWAVAASQALPGAGLHVLVGQSKDDLVAAANGRLVEELIVLAVASLFLFLGVLLLAELGIRRQVARIGRMAMQLGSGDLQARIPPPHPRGELGGLMAVLNETAASLERQQAAIEDLNLKLRQSQRMEAVGQLTGGIAHDFNNLLTIIFGAAETLIEDLADRPALRKLAETTMAAAERGAGLTRNLLAFARRQPLRPQTVDVNRQILLMEDLLRRALGEHIACRFALSPTVRLAMVDPAQLEAAILNLSLNARDAMPNGGQLILETSDVDLDEAYATQHDDVRAGPYVMVAVADSGSGMSPDVVSRAFEPFFTTKDVDKGTGLGLSMVYGFVKQSGGHIQIHSEPGHGTIVKLFLPRSDAPPIEAAPAAPVLVFGHGETILAVEDDSMVRARVENELKDLGYVVLTASDGVGALAILQSAAHIDLLFSDVVMPGGLSGPQLALQALRIRPGMKVLFTSGYTEGADAGSGGLDPGTQLLRKPYRRQELALQLRTALHAR